jgi:phosphoglycolate phosphatase-like HAD superfamily hydrolase
MEQYFKGVYGAPESKASILTKVASGLGIGAKELLMIGDAMSDYLAAKEVGARFLGRASNGHNPFEGMNLEVVPNLLGLFAFVKRISG